MQQPIGIIPATIGDDKMIQMEKKQANDAKYEAEKDIAASSGSHVVSFYGWAGVELGFSLAKLREKV